MKKLTSLLVLCLLVLTTKSQTPSLGTLIRFVNTPIADLTEAMISMNGWELTKSDFVDSVVTLQFDYKDATLLVKKVKNYKNEIFLICNKPTYDNLNKATLQLRPKLIKSEINEKGLVVKTYWGEKYGYKISIAPKSTFVFQVYDKSNPLIRELFESRPAKTDSTELENNQESNVTMMPFSLRSFNNLVLPQDDGQKTGKVAVRIKIDKGGNVIDATPGVQGTTLNDRDLWQKCKTSIMEAKLTITDTSQSKQVGVVVFSFRVK